MTTILFDTPWTKPYDGWAIASRAYARAMALAGFDVRLFARDGVELSAEVEAEVPPSMRRRTETWDGYVFSTPLGGPKAMTKAQTFPVFEGSVRPPRLFYTMFERLRVEAEVARAFNLVTQGVWVPCKHNRDALEAVGCESVAWVPFPYFPDDAYAALEPPRGPPRTFLWVGRWEPRKRPDALIRAFMTAFKPSDPQRLVLKLGPSPWTQSRYPDPEEVVEAALGGAWTRENWRDGVEVVRETLSAAQMVALHARADVYVCPSRGEGIELAAFAAKCARRRLVVTECGGPTDFVTEGDVVVPATGEVEAPEYAWIWDEGAVLIDYDEADLAEALVSALRDDYRPSRPPPVFQAASVARRFKRWLTGVL